jgi:hypothetical protein
MAGPAFQTNAFQNSGFQTIVFAQFFPHSTLDANLMAVLGFTPTETLLYDYSNTEIFYILVKPPEVFVTTLFSVSNSFARGWFASNASNSLKIVFNPFLRLI